MAWFRRFTGWLFAVLSTVLVLGSAAMAATEPRRVALVIGNSTYREAPLKNPHNDARAMAAALKERGFEVILRQNATKTDMERAIADFGEKLEEGSTGLFYYAGHGMQVNGRNFLIPVDAQITSEQRVRLETVDVDVVLDQMQAAKSKVSLVILDACRNNPFERRFRSSGGGLAQINAPEGTLISYATAPGKVAADGEGDNGLFTEELLRAVKQPGLKVEEVFKAVRIGVTRRSNGAQTPWEASSLVGDFYFVPPPPPPVQVAAVAPAPVVAAPTPPPPVVVAPAPQPQSLDLAFWDAVKGSNSPTELQAYLESFPNGTFAPLAKARIAALSRAVAPAPPPAAPPVAAPVAAAPAAVQPPPVPAAAPPSQMAALSPAPVATSTTFDGVYKANFNGLTGRYIVSSIKVEDGKLGGYVSGTMGRGGITCTVEGAVDTGGEIRNVRIDCPQSEGGPTGSSALTGRFSISGSEAIAQFELAVQERFRSSKPEWRRVAQR